MIKILQALIQSSRGNIKIKVNTIRENKSLPRTNQILTTLTKMSLKEKDSEKVSISSVI